MKSPAEYVADAWEAVGALAAAQNVALVSEKAVALALADAERYRYLLIKALRNNNSPTTPQ